MYSVAKKLADFFRIPTEIALAIVYDKAKRNDIAQGLKEIAENARFDSDAEEAASLYRAMREI